MLPHYIVDPRHDRAQAHASIQHNCSAHSTSSAPHILTDEHIREEGPLGRQPRYRMEFVMHQRHIKALGPRLRLVYNNFTRLASHLSSSLLLRLAFEAFRRCQLLPGPSSPEPTASTSSVERDGNGRTTPCTSYTEYGSRRDWLSIPIPVALPVSCFPVTIPISRLPITISQISSIPRFPFPITGRETATAN